MQELGLDLNLVKRLINMGMSININMPMTMIIMSIMRIFMTIQIRKKDLGRLSHLILL